MISRCCEWGFLTAVQELETWSNAYKTSWFRVAISLVGLLVADKTRPALGLDEVLSVAFAGRPKDMTACVGHFANSLPVKIPIWKALGPDGSSRSFRSLVSAVSKSMSAIKKAEMIAPIEVSRACRAMDIDYQPPRVAVTYSPKLARTECRLFPVEGSWDLFFCFLEYEEDVKLGVGAPCCDSGYSSDVRCSRSSTIPRCFPTRPSAT